ncbi:hypothetical protein NMY22_g16660 [Coprinellus aureogranulatus]|nr:hypothetical protein NMY22_g16660 [Coprinellus aureogranulatus]
MGLGSAISASQNASDTNATRSGGLLPTDINIEDRLYECYPESLRYTGFIRAYSAGFSVKYRKDVTDKFPEGEARVLICTDAACMFSAQDALREVTDGREKACYWWRSQYTIRYMETTDEPGPGKPRKSHGVRQSTTYPRSACSSEAYSLGGHDKANDDTGDGEYRWIIGQSTKAYTPSFKPASVVDESFYKNEDPSPTVPCCDNYNPELLDETRPSKVLPKKRNVVEIARRDFSKAFFTVNGVFGDEPVELCSTSDRLRTWIVWTLFWVVDGLGLGDIEKNCAAAPSLKLMPMNFQTLSLDHAVSPERKFS